MLEVTSLHCGYDKDMIIRNVSFTAKRKENLCIVGPNGSGKSTLLKSIGNILEYKGKITLDNIDISTFTRSELAKRIAILSQISTIHFPYTIFETVALGRYAHMKSLRLTLNKEDKDIIEESLKMVGLLDIKDTYINNLSGGQLQRVFLARTFAQNPEVILLDEPTNHLDLKYQIEILEYLKRWARDNDKILISVLHDLNLVNNFSDKVLVLNHGEVIDIGETKKVFSGNALNEAYNMNIKDFMINSLKKWEENK
ncbi:ABC transporter ATP-binding protein [uncultured Clostridium sp.]|uniref:ABC transporter ATP-binding protein n=1 Tax=uncultured Clostridium sp. TaxID=59620 RepID=UPI0025D89A49|nr:ABC transporter ATP-binding protein [uncultured Clostridium sp.]